MPVGCVPRKEGEIQVLAGQAPSSQTIGSLLRTLTLRSWPNKMPNLKLTLYNFGDFFHQKNDVCKFYSFGDYCQIVLNGESHSGH